MTAKRVLVVHPQDSLSCIAADEWDLILDLGYAPASTYQKYMHGARCRVLSCRSSGELEDATRYIHEGVNFGMGRIVDEHGIDWWELASVKFYEQLELVRGLRKFMPHIGHQDEVFITRRGFYAQILELLLNRPVHALQPRLRWAARLLHYAGALGKFSGRELLQIAADKYDAGYGFRRMVSKRTKPSGVPVVLLPSAYINASRTALRYAEMLPETNFLLVTTRASGRSTLCPANVRSADLVGYAPVRSWSAEFEMLLRHWNVLQEELLGCEDFTILARLGGFGFMPRFLREGLAVRDAWRKVFETEAVSAVLCADEANPFTCIPVLIARERGLPTIACHHGALDGRYSFLRVRADIFLAKGQMERDYLLNICAVKPEKLVIGAPQIPLQVQVSDPKRHIIFFSEPYEILAGRCFEYYREVLPPLAVIAIATGHDLIVKLHPFESRRERERIINNVLPERLRTAARVVTGTLDTSMLSHTWCALTALSSAAVDCTLQGIPVFLCGWLDGSLYGYARQFAKFGAGRILRSADELGRVPAMLAGFSPASTKDLWDPITPERLISLLERRSMAVAV